MNARGDPAVTDLDSGHHVEVPEPAFEGTGQLLEVRLGETAHGSFPPLLWLCS
ncbi:hypothetical protein ACH4UM_04280 [Streptomyces sp. NPDC020801]|uniref:hypothetical protein n=1 Tax=Streptomyces sp. NPDC020801 TaxID=3365093 RepID=UPI003791630B